MNSRIDEMIEKHIKNQYDSRLTAQKYLSSQKAKTQQTEMLIKHYAFYLFTLKIVELPPELISLVLLCGVNSHAPSRMKFSLFTPAVREHLRHRNDNVYQRIDRINKRIDVEIIELVNEKYKLYFSSQTCFLTSGTEALQKYRHELLITKLEELKVKNYDAQLQGLGFREIINKWRNGFKEYSGACKEERDIKSLVDDLLIKITEEEELRISIAHYPASMNITM